MSEETNPIEDLVQASLNQDYNAASDIFSELMNTKMADAIEQEKIAVANQIYNGGEMIDTEYDEEDLELDDEDLELDDEDLEYEDDEEEDEVEN